MNWVSLASLNWGRNSGCQAHVTSVLTPENIVLLVQFTPKHRGNLLEVNCVVTLISTSV